MKTQTRSQLIGVAILGAILASGGSAAGVDIASDSASDPVYDPTTGGNWGSGDNGGSGFGAWTLVVAPAVGYAGFFSDSGGDDDIATVGPRSFGLYGNGGGFNEATGFRSFAFGALNQSDYHFRWTMDNGSINNGGAAGLVLRTGNANSSAGDYNTASRFEFSFVGGQSTYRIYDSTIGFDTGIGFTDKGLSFDLTITSLNTYDLLVTELASGTPHSYTGRTFGGTADAEINSFAIFNRDTEFANVYFNSLQVVPEGGTTLGYSLISVGILGLSAFWRRKSESVA